MAALNYQNINLADPIFIESFKKCKDAENFLVYFCKCFNDIKILDFDAVIHYNVKEMLNFMVGDRKQLIAESSKLKSENQAFAKTAVDLMQQIDEIRFIFPQQEAQIKKLNEENQKLVKEVAKLQADLRYQRTLYETLQKAKSAEKKQLDYQINELEDKVKDLTTKNQSIAAEIKKELQKSADKAKEMDEMINATENRLIKIKQCFENEKDELRRELNAAVEVKTNECKSLEKKLKEKKKKAKTLKSKQNALVKEHEDNTKLLQAEMEQIQEEVNLLAIKNQTLTNELASITKKFDDANRKRLMVNEMAATIEKKTVSLKKQKKELKEKEMIQETKEGKKEENVVVALEHAECEKQIQRLSAKLKVTKELLQIAQNKLKEYEEKRQIHIKRVHLATACTEEIVANIDKTVASPDVKRQKTSDTLSIKHSPTSASTSFSASNPPVQQHQLQSASTPTLLHQPPTVIPTTSFFNQNYMYQPPQQHQNGYVNPMHYHQQYFPHGSRFQGYPLRQQNPAIFNQQAYIQQQPFNQLSMEQQNNYFMNQSFHSSAPQPIGPKNPRKK